MNEQIKINRILPPHELNARRARKRLAQPPARLVKPSDKPESKPKSRVDPDHDGDKDAKRCPSCSCKSHCKGCTCTSC